MDMGNIIRSLPTRRLPQASHLAAVIATVAACLLPTLASAQWIITPSVLVDETYSDNIRLAPQSQAASDFVTSITPQISASETGHYLTANAIYSLQDVSYADHNAPSSLASQLQAAANANLIDNLFYLNGLASITQQNVSALGAQPVNNIYATGNRTSVRTYVFTPSLKHTFDSDATAELDYSFGSVASDGGGMADSRTDTVTFKFVSGPAFDILVWGLQYNDQMIHYTALDDVDISNITANLSYQIVPGLHLIADTGYDNNDYSAISSVSKGNFWDGGFSWNVSELTNLAATAGHHYYGDTYSLNASTRGHLSVWNLSYATSITTPQSQFGLPSTTNTATVLNQLLLGSIPDPTLRAQAVSNIIQTIGLPSSLATATSYFTNSILLQKQLQASYAYTTPKDTILLSLYDTLSEPLSAQQDISLLLPNEKVKQLGANVLFGRIISPTMTATLNLLAARIDSISTATVSRTESLTLGLKKQFNSKLYGMIDIRRDMQQSSLASLSYHEDAIEAQFMLQF
jgi:uncharacterized protein (PEP-CTERM system associated)